MSIRCDECLQLIHDGRLVGADGPSGVISERCVTLAYNFHTRAERLSLIQIV
jgi:hypothetical protein